MNERSENVVLPTDPNDDPNWCPNCLEPRGVCGCDMPEEPPDPDGECYRGNEAASALAEEQAWIQRNLK